MRSVVLAVAAAGCGCGSDSAEPTRLFPADYAASYTAVRSCRGSPDHDLNYVRVLADPAGVAAYQLRDRPFPIGAIVIKEEHEFGDTSCTGAVVWWTVMVKLAAGSSPSTLDWHWQKVDADRTVITDNEPRCYGCHTTCGVAPGGYDGTCTVP